jgi:hypothetical protein
MARALRRYGSAFPRTPAAQRARRDAVFPVHRPGVYLPGLAWGIPLMPAAARAGLLLMGQQYRPAGRRGPSGKLQGCLGFPGTGTPLLF